ncbi:DUF3489 domain-containing protein [Mesorhizobium sp. BR1-1-16]|uniref:DUF3489 domain-containing protein n=1 Tax=Mesorhizobium sp. BR1-1-16 TaxID=2876653 RepID=UPI001CCB90FD|nr:DUF3489 domain-containing protein [Mesorhizobium sp. BR1-1-16]
MVREVASGVAADSNGPGLDGTVRHGDETEVVDDDPLDGTITWTDGGVDPVTSESDGKVDRAWTDPSSRRSPSKQDQIIALLSREEGATIEALMAATGWLPHTVRALLRCLRKKGHRIDRQKDCDAGSVYRILPSANAETAPPATGKAV